MVSPFTFSKRNNRGDKSFTALTNSRTKKFLGSSRILCPISENPWQGGPPTTTSIWIEPISAFWRIACALRRSIELGITLHFGKLYLCTAACIGSISTAAATSNPACSNPKLSPPAPEKRSIMIGLFFILSFHNIKRPLLDIASCQPPSHKSVRYTNGAYDRKIWPYFGSIYHSYTVCNFGSNASRTASPINVTVNNVVTSPAITEPAIHQAHMLDQPCWRSSPQLGVGGGRPKPR